jgi:hypothetical protein
MRVRKHMRIMAYMRVRGHIRVIAPIRDGRVEKAA